MKNIDTTKKTNLLNRLKDNDRVHWGIFILLYSLDNGMIYIAMFLMLIGVPMSTYVNSELFSTDSIKTFVVFMVLTLLQMLSVKLDFLEEYKTYKTIKENSNEQQ